MDYVSSQRLLKVHPELAQKITAMVATLEAQGIATRVVQGLRNWEDQERIYAQGRTTPGPKVTDAPPGHSMHEFGLAVDCMPSINPPGQIYIQDEVAGSSRYLAMRAIAEALGLTSGSRWLHVRPDWPHLQLIPLGNPTDQMRSDFAAGGLQKVWDNLATYSA